MKYIKGGYEMITLKNHVGQITISRDYLISLIGNTVTNCFGVVSMNVANTKQTLMAALPFGARQACDRGISISTVKDKLFVELHISLLYGVNMNAVVRAIVHKVSYTIEESTGIKVEKVSVYVDDLKV